MVRRFQPSDTQAVMQVWLHGNEDAHPFVPASYWRAHYAQVQAQLTRAAVYVWAAKGQVQGFIGLQGDYIAGLFVKRECRGQGIGCALLAFAKANHPTLTLHVYEKNQRALRFYTREGFYVVSRQSEPDTGAAEMMLRWANKPVAMAPCAKDGQALRIRRYSSGDFARLCEIHDAARRNELALAGLPDAFVPLSQAAEREGLFDYQVYVALYREMAAGFVAFSAAELGWLYVDPALSRCGIGSALVNFALPRMQPDAGIEVLAGNEPALSLYARFGFAVDATETGVMPGNESFHVTVHVLHRSGDLR